MVIPGASAWLRTRRPCGPSRRAAHRQNVGVQGRRCSGMTPTTESRPGVVRSVVASSVTVLAFVWFAKRAPSRIRGHTRPKVNRRTVAPQGFKNVQKWLCGIWASDGSAAARSATTRPRRRRRDVGTSKRRRDGNGQSPDARAPQPRRGVRAPRVAITTPAAKGGPMTVATVIASASSTMRASPDS